MSCAAASLGCDALVDRRQVLVVDDDLGMRTALEMSVRRRGWKVEVAAGAREALWKFEQGGYPLVISDIRMPDGDGLGVLDRIRKLGSPSAVILLTAFASIPEAVNAVRQGACDYLVKPVDFAELERAALHLLEQLPGAFAPPESGIAGKSPALLSALSRARQVAACDADFLLPAESGTGNALRARMIHGLSPRRARPLVAVNCAAFPETLLESELFGHVKGAFTGAVASRAGKFEQANGGTLLLDEVGEMPLSLQPKVLRALQEREFDRLGGARSVKVDIRVIATTNRPLRQMVQQGAFRADLYFRLNVIPLSLPPLRERREDIRELAEFFLRRYSPAGRVLSLSPEFLRQLEPHDWPGNVRELQNLMRRAVALSRDTIGLEILESGEIAPAWPTRGLHLAALVAPTPPDSPPNLSAPVSLEAGVSLQAAEKHLLQVTLAATAGNRSRTAEMLGISLRTVRNKIREYGLPPRGSYVHD